MPKKEGEDQRWESRRQPLSLLVYHPLDTYQRFLMYHYLTGTDPPSLAPDVRFRTRQANGRLNAALLPALQFPPGTVLRIPPVLPCNTVLIPCRSNVLLRWHNTVLHILGWGLLRPGSTGPCNV